MTRQMKDSGVEWIGEIPEDWGISKLKYLVKEPLKYGANSSGCEFNDELPRYIRITDISKDNQLIQTDKLSINIDENSEFILQDGDILFARSGATVGKTFIYQKEMGLSGFAGYLIRARINKDNLSKYIYYITLSSYYEQWKDSILIQATIENIGADKYNNLIMTAPPKKEQQKIVGFLDNKTKEIENIIIKSKQAIEEYKRYKQALITETVTKGLDKSVPMKDSGIEILGKTPESFDLIKLKYLVSANQCTLNNKTSDDYYFRYIDIGSVDFHHGVTGYEQMKFDDAPSRARRIVKKGDLIVSTVRTYLRAIATITDDEDVIVSTGFAVLTPENINAKYLEYFTKTEYFISEVIKKSVGVSYPAINTSDLLEIKILYPDMQEQQEIADYLDKKTSQIDEIISKKEKLVEEMEAYKKSLIFETVTGKREVD